MFRTKKASKAMNCKNCELYKGKKKLLEYRKSYYYKNKLRIRKLQDAYFTRKKIRDYRNEQDTLLKSGV